MKVIQSRIIPFKGFAAINLFGVVVVRKDYAAPSFYYWEKLLRHEEIHTAQMKELWYIGFYLLYFFEWLYWLVRRPKSAYFRISFEREAYEHQSDPYYLANRKKFAQWK